MNIKLSPETSKKLKALCKEVNITPTKLILAFLQDLTSTPGSGADERYLAEKWYNRHLIDNEFYY